MEQHLPQHTLFEILSDCPGRVRTVRRVQDSLDGSSLEHEMMVMFHQGKRVFIHTTYDGAPTKLDCRHYREVTTIADEVQQGT
jgi:hypothetical protein